MKVKMTDTAQQPADYTPPMTKGGFTIVDTLFPNPPYIEGKDPLDTAPVDPEEDAKVGAIFEAVFAG